MVAIQKWTLPVPAMPPSAAGHHFPGKWDFSLGHEWISELKACGYHPTLGLSWHKILRSRNLTMSRKMGFSWPQDVFRFSGFFWYFIQFDLVLLTYLDA
jgi:hypothetical protein